MQPVFRQLLPWTFPPGSQAAPTTPPPPRFCPVLCPGPQHHPQASLVPCFVFQVGLCCYCPPELVGRDELESQASTSSRMVTPVERYLAPIPTLLSDLCWGTPAFSSFSFISVSLSVLVSGVGMMTGLRGA